MASKFNIKLTDKEYGTLGALAEWMDVSMADVMREAIAVAYFMARQYRNGSVFMIKRGDQTVELHIAGMDRLRPVAAQPEIVPAIEETRKDLADDNLTVSGTARETEEGRRP